MRVVKRCLAVALYAFVYLCSPAAGQTFGPSWGDGSGVMELTNGSFFYRGELVSAAWIQCDSSLINKTNPWLAKISVSLPAITFVDGPRILSFGLSLGSSNLLNSNFLTMTLDQINVTSAGPTTYAPLDFRGVAAQFAAQDGSQRYYFSGDFNDFYTTTPAAGAVLWSGKSYLPISTHSNTPLPVTVEAASGEVALAFDGTNAVTGYYNGDAVGSLDVSTWSEDLNVYVFALSRELPLWESTDISGTNFQVVPEPSTYALLLFGLCLSAWSVKQRRSCKVIGVINERSFSADR